MDKVWNIVTGIVVGIIVIAILAAILSKRSASVSVIQSASNAFNTLLKQIVSPISASTGGTSALGGLNPLNLNTGNYMPNLIQQYGFTQ